MQSCLPLPSSHPRAVPIKQTTASLLFYMCLNVPCTTAPMWCLVFPGCRTFGWKGACLLLWKPSPSEIHVCFSRELNFVFLDQLSVLYAYDIYIHTYHLDF